MNGFFHHILIFILYQDFWTFGIFSEFKTNVCSIWTSFFEQYCTITGFTRLCPIKGKLEVPLIVTPVKLNGNTCPFGLLKRPVKLNSAISVECFASSLEKEVPNPFFPVRSNRTWGKEEQGWHKALLAFRARFQGPVVLKQRAKGGNTKRNPGGAHVSSERWVRKLILHPWSGKLNNDQALCIQYRCNPGCASWVELSFTEFWAWDAGWKWRIEATGIWYPRITCTWVQTDYFELFPSYWAVSSRSVTCLQLLLGHSPVPGVADAARREEMEQLSFPWASWDASWLLGWVLALPYFLLVPLEREAFYSVSETPGMQRRWSSWAGDHAKEELGLRASLRGVTPVETGTCSIYLLNKSLQSSLY